MRLEFDLSSGFSGPHSFAWRARATEFEQMRVLARAAIVSGDFTALAAWADRRRPEHDQRRRVACVKFGPEADDLIWAWTSRDPEGHARAFETSWHNDFSARRTRFFEEFDLAALAGDPLVFADTAPVLEVRPSPPKLPRG